MKNFSLLEARKVLFFCANLQADLDAAIWFTHQYVTEVCELFMNPLEMYANHRLAMAIKDALAKDILKGADLFLQDEDVLRRLYGSRDPDIVHYLGGLRPGIKVVEDENVFDAHARSKARIVDPLVLMGDGKVIRCSVLEPKVKRWHSRVLRKAQRGVFMRLV